MITKVEILTYKKVVGDIIQLWVQLIPKKIMTRAWEQAPKMFNDANQTEANVQQNHHSISVN